MTEPEKNTETLDQLVDKLSGEIRSGVDNFSKELADMLAGVDRDLYHLKNRDAAESHEIHAARERLKDVALHFYSDHPRISELANDLVVLIKRLGL